MLDENGLKKILHRIDKRGYKAYKDIEGAYAFAQYTLFVDHVQGDPFASPSRVRVRVPQSLAKFPKNTYENRSREIALRDLLTRKFAAACRKFSKGRKGTGKSGLLAIDGPGQEILERTSVFVTDLHVEARFVMGLPAFGRRVAGKQAEDMFFAELPQIVSSSVFFESLDEKKVYEHIETAEDADFLRSQLETFGLVAFVAEGAILPRASGVDPRPLAGKCVVPFVSPESLKIEVKLPHRGPITGMGVPEGVTLIVGGGYHGKSTLLDALELGIYNHIPGDGREFVVTGPMAMKIRAEDGRRIEKTDISPFISDLPFGQDTRGFSTEDASGSTSQAANIIEALEVGAKALLIDEDTSATNFMIRDHRMQELVSKDREPITPFIDKIRQLYADLGVSPVLVMGGSGDYFDVADLVICMVEYKPYDMTEQARGIARKYESERKTEGGTHFGTITERIPLPRSFDPRKGKKKVKISPKGVDSILFGVHHIELDDVEQLVDTSQTRALGQAIHYATRYVDGRRTLREVVELVLRDVRERSLDVLVPSLAGDYAMFRELEFAAAINRLRTLCVNQTAKQ